MELLCNNCQKRINGWKLETWEIKKQKVKDEAVYCEHTWNADHTLNTVTNHFDKDKQILPKENTFSYAYSYGCSKCNFISRGNNYRDNYLDDKHEFDKKKNLIHKEERERERERERQKLTFNTSNTRYWSSNIANCGNNNLILV